MTGTINPDGTIGPVGGIAQKIDGAARSDMSRFATPLGQRRDVKLCTGEVEDMVEVGRTLGVEVAEVGDIREAYAFLTGIALPETASSTVSRAVPKELRDAFRGLYQAWFERYRAARAMVSRAECGDFNRELQSF